MAAVKYENVLYFYRKDAQGNIVALIDLNGNVVTTYNYDAWGNHTVSGSNISLGNANPFRYRGYYYDTETNLYYLQTRFYDPEVGRFISQDSVEYADPETINGLNLYAYCGNNPVMYVDPTGTAEWWQWFLSGLQFLGGIALCFVPGGQAAGAAMIVGGGLGLIANAVSPRISQALGGVASIANGWGAFSTGMAMLGYGTPGIIGGLFLMVVGGATMLFGANEIATAVTGENAIINITGMSEEAYNWTYLGLNVASSFGQIAGAKYYYSKSRTLTYNRDGSIRQIRHYSVIGDFLYDIDFGHGKITWKHYHAWLRNGTRLGKKHTGYFIMILQLFGRIFH